jgi:hypothetical protein
VPLSIEVPSAASTQHRSDAYDTRRLPGPRRVGHAVVTRAWILVQVREGWVADVLHELRSLDAVHAWQEIGGAYDLVVEMRAVSSEVATISDIDRAVVALQTLTAVDHAVCCRQTRQTITLP